MNVNFLKKNAVVLLSVIAILAMFLTFITFSVESDFMDNTQKCTAITACQYSVFGYILILGPVVLIAAHFMKQTEAYKPLLSVVIPALCLLGLIVLFFSARDGLRAGGDIGSGFGEALGVDVDYSISIGFGTILMALSHILMLIIGIKSLRQTSISKPRINGINMDNVKNAGVDLLQSAKESVSGVAQSIANSIPASSSSSKKQIDDILTLIERLSQMKNDGILTEEEFSKKKAKLLEEI